MLFRSEVETIKPLFWLGEYDELDNPDYATVFDASYSWKWMHLTKEFYQKKLPITDLTNLLSQYSAIGNKSMRAWFTTNHDKILGTEQNMKSMEKWPKH